MLTKIMKWSSIAALLVLAAASWRSSADYRTVLAALVVALVPLWFWYSRLAQASTFGPQRFLQLACFSTLPCPSAFRAILL